MKPPTQHVLLRDRRRWHELGQASGLEIDRDGALTLQRVPGPADGKPVEIASSYPAQREVSGLALGPCMRVFVADTAHDRVLLVEPQCKSQTWLNGFKTPRGLALGGDALLAADSGNQRVQGVALPALEAHWAPVQGVTVTCVAVDSRQRLVFVDATSQTVRRVSCLGVQDTTFDSAIFTSARLAAPLFVAVGAEDRVLVSDGAHNRVDVFDADGNYFFGVAGPSGWLPGALVAGAGRLYVADAADGRILAFDAAGALQGALSGWRGPVTALALAAGGDLYIKPGLDASYLQFSADAAHVDSGILLAGPFDAGEQRTWERAWFEGATPVGTSIAIKVAQTKDATPAPAEGDWKDLPGTDALLAPLLPVLSQRRHVWLHITLATTQVRSTPVLRQARAATAAEDLREHLPMTYRRNDPAALLEHLLQLLRGEYLAVEEDIDDMPRVADPRFALGSSLSWLAQWLALELPQIGCDDDSRQLIARATALFARRGSPAAIAEFVELHTGIRPTIVESFAQRRLWVLGGSSQLGFDTQLPPMDPSGMVVPDPQTANGCCPVADGEPVIGRAVVGESGPLALGQVGLPLFADEAYRFCVLVDAYRVADPQTLQEIQRVVDREKPAHTDYRITLVQPDLRVGFQCHVGIDTLVGGEPPALRLGLSALDRTTQLPPSDVTRLGALLLDGSLTLT